MGTLRLFLATAVLLNHAGFRIFHLNPGVTAVICFYLISGYVMVGLVQSHYDGLRRIPKFYLDRILRLFPQYLFYAFAVFAWQRWTGNETFFLARAPTGVDLFNNLTAIPLNFYMYNGADKYILIPPAWSLGAELQFYLLAPFMLFWPRVGLALAGLSLGIHALALHGVLNTDWYGFRLLPGVLWVFGVGMLMFIWQRTRPRLAAALAWCAPVLAAFLYFCLRGHGLHGAPHHQEVLIGWGIGIPLVHWLSRLRPGRWDAFAGDVSYGVFLNHFLLIWVLFPQLERTPLQMAVIALSSIALSALTQRWIERPVLAWRRRLRKSTTVERHPRSEPDVT